MTSSFPSAAAMNSRSMTTCRPWRSFQSPEADADLDVTPTSVAAISVQMLIRHRYALFICPTSLPAPHHSSRDYFGYLPVDPSNTRLAHARNPAPANGNFCSITSEAPCEDQVPRMRSGRGLSWRTTARQWNCQRRPGSQNRRRHSPEERCGISTS